MSVTLLGASSEEFKDMRTVLVTAASGTAGRSIVEALLGRGLGVVAASRKPHELTFSKKVEGRVYDADVATDFGKLFAGVDDIVLVAPPIDGSIDRKLASFIDAAATFLKERGRLVYLSGNYISGMSGVRLKALPVWRIEQNIIASVPHYAIVRAGFFMDNFTTGFYKSLVDQGALSFAAGDAKSALIAAADVADFIAETLVQKLTGTFTITGPEAIDHYEVARLLSIKLNRDILYKPITEEALIEYYTAKSLSAESIAFTAALYRAYRNYATAPITDEFEEVTGRAPVRFSRFLELK